MAVNAGLLSTYDIGFAAGSGNREDLLDVIINIDPWDTPLFTNSPKTVAAHTTHEWQTDILAATSTAGAVEGDDFGTGATLSARTRRSNITQIFRKDFIVSNTQRAVNPAGVSDEYSYQVGKALKEIARNIEIRALAASGASATASEGSPRVFANLQDFIVTGTAGNARHVEDPEIGGTGTAGGSSALREVAFNGELELIFADGGNPDSIYASPRSKRRISQGFGNANFAGNGRYSIAQVDKKIVNSVDVYDSDFGMVKIILDRWVPQATGTASADLVGNLYFIETSMVRFAFLRPIRHVPLPPVGDAARAMVLGELTLEVGNPQALGRIFAINTTV